MSVGNRIRALRTSLKLSQPQLAKKAGLGQSTISDLENDKKSTSAENMEALASALGTTVKYLLKGEVEKLSAMDKIIDFERELKSQRLPSSQYELSEFNKDLVEIKFFDDLPVSCGVGTIAQYLENEARTLVISAKPLKERNIKTQDCVAFHAIGDSMYPTIKNKDIVYVDKSRNKIRDGKIFAINHGGLFKFKRLYQLPLGGIRVVSDNSAEYPEERLTAQDIIDQRFEIIGWAWSWQSMESW